VNDPFALLGLPTSASADDVRAARRRLAKDHHPDAGGSADGMVALNRAAREALALLATAASCSVERPRSPQATRPGTISTDVPSFTVEALPVETFEALLVVASWIGEMLDDDPPYRLDVHLYEPAECWCRLDLVPDAGSSTVSLSVGAVGEGTAPDVESVRDTWVAHLNQLDWP
jgi:hypothetical protein